MKSLLAKLWRDEEGQDMVEYALLAALIGIVIAAVLPFLTNAIKTTFNNIGTTLNTTAS